MSIIIEKGIRAFIVVHSHASFTVPPEGKRLIYLIEGRPQLGLWVRK